MQQQQQQQHLTNQTVTTQPSLQFQLQQTSSGALTQQQQSQPHQQHLANNIIVVRGSRNEHGEIVIQNKQDIFTFLTEHHQQQQQQQQLQQQQQQNEKATVATLTQLPPTTTVARKTSISLLTNGGNGLTVTGGVGGNAMVTATTAAIPKESNTILLQTPINASQLETVLLQSGQLKKSNSTVSAGTTDRPFLFKNASRSLSTDSNRFGTAVTATSTTATGDDKGPFVLQTLKRLEKSQSILVIRNSSSSSSSATAGSNSTSSLSNSSSSLATSLTVEHKLSLSSSSLSSMQQQQQQQQHQQLATTANVNTKGNTITFTRSKKTQKSNGSTNTNSSASASSSATTTKLGDILASATGQRHLLASSSASNGKATNAVGATTTTTYLRLTNGSGTGSNNNNNNNVINGSNIATTIANIIHKNHNSSRASLNGKTTETIAAAGAGTGGGGAGSAPSLNTSTAPSSTSVVVGTTTTQHLNLADVQLKHERSSPSVVVSSTTVGSGNSSAKTQGSDGDPIKLPDNLESLPRADSFPSQRHRWNTNEEIAAILISFDKHNEWQSKEVKTRPKSGSLLLYSRKKVRYRRDGYCWKKRKDGKTTREDHMKLKVQGTECIYGCYVHSAILPTFHRRCYWLLQNPDIVLVHYLNVPYPDDNKMAVIAPSISLWGDKKEWTKEELVSQLKPMLSTVTSDDESDSGNDIEISTAETVESIVCQLMEKQRLSRQAALVKQLDCGCGDASCADGKTCTHPVMRRPSLIKSTTEKRLPASASDNFAHSTAANGGTPNVIVGPKLYSRWLDKRIIRGGEANTSMDTNGGTHYQSQQQQQQQQHHHGHGHHPPTQQLTQESAIKFQIIPPHNEQQQQYRHYNNNSTSTTTVTAANQHHQQLMNNTRNNLIMQQQQQQHQQMQTNQTNFNQLHSNSNNNSSNLQRYTGNNNTNNHNVQQQQQQQRFQIAKTTITAMDHSSSATTTAGGIPQSNNSNNNTNNNNTTNQATAANNQQQHNHNQHSTTTTGNASSGTTSCAVKGVGGGGGLIMVGGSGPGSGGGGGGGVDVVDMLNHHQQQQQQQHTTNTITKLNHNTNISNINGTVTTTIASLQHQLQQQNDLSAITNNGTNGSNTTTNSSSTKFTTNYNQQQQHQQQQQQHQINTSNNNNNSMLNHQQQQQQQKHQHEQFYKLQTQNNKHQQQQQPPASATVITTSTSSSSSSSNITTLSSTTVEPMCMSPEHQPLGSSTACTTSPHNKQHQQPHLMISSTDTISENSSSSSIAMSASSSSQHTFTDVNQKSTAAAATATTAGDNAQMSSNNDMNTSNNNNINVNNNSSENNTNNRNNQLDDFNNCNINKNPTTGCAASDASNCNNNNNSILNQNSQNTQNPTATTTKTNNSDNLHSNNSSIGFETIESNGHLNQMEQQPGGHTASDLHDTLGFFNETLDLSHEDIQRTLIANMPNESTLLTSLDFMHAEVGSGGTGVAASAPAPQIRQCEPDQLSAGAEADDEDTDDVFAHLDAFDMLVEFPELDLDDKQALSNTALEQAAAGVALHHASGSMVDGGCHHQHLQALAHYDVTSGHSDLDCDKKFLKICDFSPDWSYPEGGVKVLVAGPWSSECHYTVLFDSQPVPTVLVQEGVLRCYCPAHEVGYATLQVSSDGFVISDSVMFEYKMFACQEAPFDANTNECLYKFSLYHRLSTIEESLQPKTEIVTELSASQQIFSLHGNLEEKLVGYCHDLTKKVWQSNAASSGTAWNTGYKGMTLLHLAAALGYNKLLCALLSWRTENPHIILETEIDAFSQDAHGYTPLTWACSRGHLETAIVLYKWNQNALKIKNHAQQTPLDVAHVKGHKQIVAELYRLEHERQRKQSRGSLSSLSINLNKYALCNNDGSDENPSFSVFDTTDVSQRSHDGVFLRPVAVNSNQSPPNNSRFSKRSSIDSGISMDVRSKPVKTFKDLTRLHSLDAHDNYGASIESPLDSIATTGNTTNSLLSPMRKMDFALCEVSTGDSSPLPNDKNNDDDDDDDASTIDNEDCCNDVVAIPNKNIDAVVGDSDAKVLTLAEHIIAAMPERIKNEADEMMVLGSPLTEPLNSESSGLNDSFMDPLLDSLPNAHFDNEFSFDFNDHSYRYHEVSTPCSSLSPASSGPLQSPASYSILGHDPSVSSPSPPPSTKQLTEFLHASSNSQYPFEADFSKLTLTDTEQRELYEAAKCIQKAYRSYKGRQKLEEQNKERTAAIVIQNYYRRYKQFAYYRQMTNAALVIQHGYRSYCRNKRFKKSQNCSSALTACGSALHSTDSQDSTNSQCLSSFFDNFTKQETNTDSSPQSCATPKETSPSGPLKRTYSQSTQNQAARKIQQFMRQSRIKLQKERAEKEKLVHQRRAEYLQNLQYQGQPEIVCPLEKSDTPTSLNDSNQELVNSDITNNNNHQIT